MSVRHLTESDAALTESIKSDLNRVVTTVEQVKTACNTIMDGITVVRELASENKHGSDVVVDGMNKLTGNNKQLQSHTASSQEMTTDISSQVENVAAMINDMVSLTTESGKHAKVSSEDLEGLAQTAKTMSELSTEVENILTTFRDEFEMVKMKPEQLIIFQTRQTSSLLTLLSRLRVQAKQVRALLLSLNRSAL